MKYPSSPRRVSAFSAVFLLAVFSCAGTPAGNSAAAGTDGTTNRLTLVATGDNLYHDILFRPNPQGVRDFSGYYLPVKPIIQSADIAFVNQETVFAGEAAGFSGYPRFNTPWEAGLALVQTGFNVVNQATNHTMDRGEAGVLSTLDYWDTVPGITVTGAYRSQEDRDSPAIIEMNGIKTGFLSYTYGTNGLPVPAGKPWLVALIDKAVMEREINALRPRCDFLVVSVHWGSEYTHTPEAGQRDLAAFMASLGVDLVIGHHPHVLQPMESIPKSGGGQTVVAYSLGNFISAQTNNNRLLGGILYAEVVKNGTGVSIEKSGIIPVVTHYESGFANIGVYPLDDYTPQLAARHRNAVNRDLGFYEISVDYFKNLARNVLQDSILDYRQIGKSTNPAT